MIFEARWDDQTGRTGSILPDIRRWLGSNCARNNRHVETTGAPLQDEMTIAAGIRSARRDAGLTQEDLAHLAGTSVRTVRAIETGTGNPSLQAVAAVANVLGLQLVVR